MHIYRKDTALQFLDQLVAEGQMQFAFRQAVERLGRSETATANLLKRMLRDGLIERVCRGKYAIRPLGVLGTAAASEDVLFAVGAGFSNTPHRVAFRTALEELDLLTHPSRLIQVASIRSTRTQSLSQRPLQVIIEPEETIGVGATKRGVTFVSNLERALLDAASRPALVGGASVLAEALIAGAGETDTKRLVEYAHRLGRGAALRRIGSIADALNIPALAGQLVPLAGPTSDIELEPRDQDCVWRDTRWWVRWPLSRAELGNVAQQ